MGEHPVGDRAPPQRRLNVSLGALLGLLGGAEQRAAHDVAALVGLERLQRNGRDALQWRRQHNWEEGRSEGGMRTQRRGVMAS